MSAKPPLCSNETRNQCAPPDLLHPNTPSLKAHVCTQTHVSTPKRNRQLRVCQDKWLHLRVK